MLRLRAYAGGQVAALGGVFGNRDLRRLEFAWGAFFAVEWMSLLALSVWAYGEGGAAAVGLVGLLRMLPAAFALPFGSAFTDRFPRHRVLAIVYGAQALLLALVAVAIQGGWPAAFVYAAVALVGVSAAPCRPAQLSLTPLLARSPDELVAANVTASTFEGLGTITGPAVAAALLAVGAAPLTLAAAAATSALAALLVAGLRARTDPTRAARVRREPVVAGLTGGVRELGREPDLAVVIAAFCVQAFVRGTLIVYVVAVALVTLELGDAGVGLLNGAFGAGMLVGAIVAASLVGRRRLSRPFAAGLALWGLPLAAVAAWPHTGVALTAFTVAGLGNAVLDVSGFTLIQRVAPDRALGRVFGVMFVGVVASVGLGSIAAPAAIDLLGLRWALASTGAILPLLAVVLLPRLTKVDSRAVVADSALEAIAAVPLFAPLPPVSQEKLARAATPLPLAAGETLMRAGERGDAFYVLLDGALRVTDEGLALRDLGPGDCCGEIALMRDVPRTATVEAVTDARLLVVHRPDFLSAVLGTPEAGAAAERIITQRLATTTAPGRVER